MSFERSLLGDSQRHLFDCYKRLYAEMLFRWNLLVARAKILKYLSVNTEIYRDVEYVTECSSCARVTKAPLCKECRKPLLKCVLCRLPVKGLANACLNCGHGGHTLHMKVWFSVRFHRKKGTYLAMKLYLNHFLCRKMNTVQLAVAAHVYLMLSSSERFIDIITYRFWIYNELSLTDRILSGFMSWWLKPRLFEHIFYNETLCCKVHTFFYRSVMNKEDRFMQIQWCCFHEYLIPHTAIVRFQFDITAADYEKHTPPAERNALMSFASVCIIPSWNFHVAVLLTTMRHSSLYSFLQQTILYSVTIKRIVAVDRFMHFCRQWIKFIQIVIWFSTGRQHLSLFFIFFNHILP